MPKPAKFVYEKKAPFRDASFFIVVCEGKNREPAYYRFFEGISSRVKIVPVASEEGNSAPKWLPDNAKSKEEELGVDPSVDQTWFVIDTDRWRQQIRELREECARHPNWKVVESNPCFEVFLYYHLLKDRPELEGIDQCKNWKPMVNTVIKGGFNTDFHPIAIETAIAHAKANYQAEGFSPAPGSTQLWELGEALLAFIKKDLDGLKAQFPGPEAA